jgi:hypothetical protein
MAKIPAARDRDMAHVFFGAGITSAAALTAIM